MLSAPVAVGRSDGQTDGQNGQNGRTDLVETDAFDINISRNLSCEILIKYFIDETDQVHKYYHCASPIII